MNSFDLPRAIRLASVLLIALVGLIHLSIAPEHFKEAAYIGWAFVANTSGAGLATIGIDQDARWGWSLGLLIAGVAFIAFVISRTLGLPGYTDEIGNWSQIGVYSLIVEGLFVALYLSVVAGAAPIR